jgi:hypothetical protein
LDYQCFEAAVGRLVLTPSAAGLGSSSAPCRPESARRRGAEPFERFARRQGAREKPYIFFQGVGFFRFLYKNHLESKKSET